MITAALNGQLDDVEFINHPVFGIAMPVNCPNVPSELLNPRNTWADACEYDKKANHLSELFNTNFKQYADGCNTEILDAAPKAMATA